LLNAITRDETWVYGHDEKKRPSLQKILDSLCPQKAQQVRSKVKTMLIFFRLCGIVHHEFILASQTVNQAYYLEVLRRVRGAVRRKQPEMRIARTRKLQRFQFDISRQSIRYLSSLLNISIRLTHHPLQTVFFSIPKIKMTLKGRFQVAEDIVTNTTDELKAIQQTSFELCFQRGKGHEEQ
jgi:hypothetical protein